MTMTMTMTISLVVFYYYSLSIIADLFGWEKEKRNKGPEDYLRAKSFCQKA